VALCQNPYIKVAAVVNCWQRVGDLIGPRFEPHISHTRGRLVPAGESSNPQNQPNLTQCCKWFATTSTSMQVAVFPWCYDAEMAPLTRYMLRRNMVSIMKGLV